MIDTRTALEFQGVPTDYYTRNGHIPRSVLFPFDSLFERTGQFISKEQYLKIAPPEIFQSVGLVAYCEVGVRAACFAILHEAYTGKTVPVYDGSLVEWHSYNALPVLAM